MHGVRAGRVGVGVQSILDHSRAWGLWRAAGLAIAAAPATAWAQAGLNAANGPQAQAQAQVPLTGVTLYRSGVASFEHRGRVEDDAQLRLSFEREKLDDILKSLVLLDLNGGRIDAAGYESGEPLERRLAGFGLNIGDNPEVWKMMDRLRGERLAFELADRRVEGRLISREQRTLPEGGGEIALAQQVVSLLTERGIETLPVERIVRFEILSPRLKDELEQALLALAGARDADRSAIDLTFRGRGRRDVMVAYVHEAPVWKTSYRLVLPESGDGATLQAWAIVENTTDADWRDVTLSLVSGRPVSFRMGLSEPLYLQRPEVPVPIEVAAAPKSFAGLLRSEPADAAGDRFESVNRFAVPRSEAGVSLSPFGYADSDGAFAGGRAVRMTEALAQGATGVSPEEIGEVFRFTLDRPVTIERRRAAMLPILTERVEARRVSIYSAGSGVPNPMRGAEIVNQTGLKLMPGPVAVYDGSAYAGDAGIRHVAVGDSRLLGYAMDLDVTVQEHEAFAQRVRRVTVSDGLIVREEGQEFTQTFKAFNADRARGRELVIETTDRPGWELSGAKPAGVTDGTARFELKLAPGGSGEVGLTWRRTTGSSVALVTIAAEELAAWSRDGVASQEVIEAAREAQRLNTQIFQAERELKALQAERGGIGDDQGRVRENLKAVDATSELARRYLRILDQQETRLETLGAEIIKAEADLERRREALRTFLSGLNVK